MSDAPDFCREGCYWEDCGHRAPLTVEDRLHRAFEPSEATRKALADEHGVDLELTAAPLDRDSDITVDDLIRFYERAGFVFAGPDGWRMAQVKS